MKELNEYLKNLNEYFKERIESIFIYGSNAHVEESLLKNNINLMIITDKIEGDDIKQLSKPTNKWMKNNPIPIFMGLEEWYDSSDVYAMEYSDIKDNHKILVGKNIIENIQIEKSDIRLQCETETKNLLMRLRSHYLQYADNPERVLDSFIPVTKTIIAIFKAILKIKEIKVPEKNTDIIKSVGELLNINEDFYLKLVCTKEQHCKLKKEEIYETTNTLIHELSKLLKHVNNL